ncbi:MAG: hypothetical protein CSYNP_02796 [Syntrophus sp. SKADARSKE-3]|nr:hypothetical protein [Syntrophus sp. SKADARSKE-3]
MRRSLGLSFFILLISFIFPFCTFASFAENILTGTLDASPRISGSNQMSAGDSQTLSVIGARAGETYTWALAAGGGYLSGVTGNFIVYTAPVANPNCAGNPTITLSVGSKVIQTMTIAVNGAGTGSGIVARIYGECKKFGEGRGDSPACGSLACGNTPGFNVWTQKSLAEYKCDGTLVARGAHCFGVSSGCCGSICQTCANALSNTACSSIADCAGPSGDLRTPDQMAAGCCPAALISGSSTFIESDTNSMGGGGSSCPQSPNIDAESAVNIRSGNLYFTQNTGILTLAYNSIDSYEGLLGKHWTHNYNQRILLPSSDNTTLTLKAEDGNVITFRLSGSVYYPEALSGDTSQIIKNPNNTYVRTTKTGITYKFDTIGRLVLISSPDVYKVTALAYYDNSIMITHPSGKQTILRTTDNKITSINDPGGRTYSLGYTNGLLTSITDPLGNIWRYNYDKSGKMLSKVDPEGRVISYAYDTTGKILTTTDPEGKTRSFNYYMKGTTFFTDKDGSNWTYNYDPLFTVKTAKKDSAGNITRYTYDAKRNLTSIIAPDGTTTMYNYDTNNNMTSITNGNGNITFYIYNTLNQLTNVIDALGNTTQYEYNNSQSYLSKITDAKNAVTQYQYADRGNLTAVIDPLNRRTTMTYDIFNNLHTVTDPKGGITTMDYDLADNIIRITDPSGACWTFRYNGLNQMTAATDPKGMTTTFTYNFRGDRLTATDANSNTINYAYNYRGQLTQITDALSHITQLSYGASSCGSGCGGAEKLTALTDALGHSTHYAYDLRGRLFKEKDNQNNYTSYHYDTRDNLSLIYRPNSKNILYGHDGADRLRTKTYLDNTTVSFNYDPVGNITTATNGNISYVFQYDENNRITSITDSQNRTIQYQYDDAGNRIAMIAPDGKTTTYKYDANNLLTRIITDQGWFDFTYYANNRRFTRTFPNRTVTTYSYDQNSNITDILTQKNGTTLDSVTYTLDNVGNRITKSLGNKTWTYSYDPVYRVRQVTNGSGTTETYTYDAVGNRLSAGGLSPNTEPTTTTAYNYDDENRLAGVTITQNGNIKELRFDYDPFGRRISKTIVRDQIGTDCASPNICPRTANYVYDNQNIIMEYDQTGTVTARYTHGPKIDDPLAMEKNGQTYYFHADGLGSITAISNAQGIVVQQYAYDTFGNTSVTMDGNIQQPYAFTGREFDKETGMYFYRARYYDPTVGRFVTKAPIGFAGGDVNLYGYVSNNPVNWGDSFGLEAGVTVSQPAGWGSSSFGHVSTDINGTTYSYGPNGMRILSTKDYFDKNNFRDGVDVRLKLTPQKEVNLQQCLSKSQGDYSSIGNNCGRPVQRCLKALGIDTNNQILPVSLGNELLNMPVADGVNSYPASKLMK